MKNGVYLKGLLPSTAPASIHPSIHPSVSPSKEEVDCLPPSPAAPLEAKRLRIHPHSQSRLLSFSSQPHFSPFPKETPIILLPHTHTHTHTSHWSCSGTLLMLPSSLSGFSEQWEHAAISGNGRSTFQKYLTTGPDTWPVLYSLMADDDDQLVYHKAKVRIGLISQAILGVFYTTFILCNFLISCPKSPFNVLGHEVGIYFHGQSEK